MDHEPKPCETCRRECPRGALLCHECVNRGVGGPVYTETGRRISGPRLQNTPLRTTEGREFEEAFASPSVMVDTDYPAIDERMAEDLPKTAEETRKAADAALAKYEFKLGKVRSRTGGMLIDYELVDLRGGPPVYLTRPMHEVAMSVQMFGRASSVWLVMLLVMKARSQRGGTT